MADPVGALVQLWNKQRQDQADQNTLVRQNEESFLQGLGAIQKVADANRRYPMLNPKLVASFKEDLGAALQEQDPEKQMQAIMNVGTKYNGFMGMDKQINTYLGALGKVRGKGKAELSPYLQKAKDTRTEKLITTLEENSVKRSMLNDANEALNNIDSGIYGKVRKGMLKNLSPDNPMLGDWQKIKMVLTDAQLLNTAKTKGAISDREMELFADAAANNDLVSSPAVRVVFNKLVKFIDADENAQVKSYERLYGENPKDWGISSGESKISAPKPKADKFRIGQTFSKNGKTYKYIGNNQWSF